MMIGIVLLSAALVWHDLGAREVLAPLGDGPELEGVAKAYLNTTLGRIAVMDGDLEQARAPARTALASEPGYEQALSLLDIIEDEEWYEAVYQDTLEYRRRRWLMKRREVQRIITTAAPTLSEALSVYTKGALTGMARLLPVRRGWSSLRKAELRLRIEEALREPFLVERVTAWMPEDQRAALREVLSRRFKRANQATDTWAIQPDLILIDGGKAQLNAALEVKQEAGLDSLFIASLAKEHEEVFIPGQSEPVDIPHNSPALYVLQRARDEAHRFAISYHQKLRSKRSIASALDVVPGIGSKRKKALLKKFGSIEAIKVASPEELSQITCIPINLAKNIKGYL